jgi:hypothetical protein
MAEKLRTPAARWLRDHNPVDVFPMDTDELERRLVMVEEQAWRVMLHEVGVAVRFRHDRMHGRLAFPCDACPVPFKKLADASYSPASPKSPALSAERSADGPHCRRNGRRLAGRTEGEAV